MRGPDPCTVLVVDDDATSRRLLARMLAGEGYTVLEAASAEDGLRVALRSTVDAFLLDVRMPRMGGIELCRRLRMVARYRMAPILFVTAVDEERSLREAFAAGGDDFITKPFSAVVLRARLGAHLQKLEYYRQLERVRRNLARYVSPRTQQLVEAYTVTGILPPPIAREVCVLFSDIRGFTALAHEIPPVQLFDILSRHLGVQVDLVYSHGGYIDKFGGDGVMAVFEGPQKSENACRCALDILEAAAADPANQERPLLQVGIGIHTGEALIGNIGSEEHLDYSVIGQTVNIASRLCDLAEPAAVVVSEAVARGVRDEGLRFGPARTAWVHGLREPVTVRALEPPYRPAGGFRNRA